MTEPSLEIVNARTLIHAMYTGELKTLCGISDKNLRFSRRYRHGKTTCPLCRRELDKIFLSPKETAKQRDARLNGPDVLCDIDA